MNGTWVNDETITQLPDGATELTESEWNSRQSIPYQPTPEESKERWNEEIKRQLAALDLKRIRPLAEGDTVFLSELNKRIVELRAQLK